MPVSMIPAFALYCAVSAITPGPANLCSLAAAMRYGRRRALRQWRGMFVGFAVVALAASLVVWFLGGALIRYLRVMKWLGAAYILWLAYHILRGGGAEASDADARCNFLTGFLVQITNAKIIVFCVTVLTTYALPYASGYGDVLRFAAFLPFTGPVMNLVWLFAGTSLQRFFREHQKPVNAALALSLVFCAVSIICA